MNMRLLLLLLFSSVVMYTSCQSTSAPIDSLAARVTENTSKDQILFRLVTDEADPAKDYFEIDSKDGKVLITGNSDLSLATGLNWYLKYVAGIHLSWNNPSQKLPEVLPLPQKKIRQATAMKNRYYLNYCTYSYSMAFWDWERWEKEIDWMAMHGINMPLSITGMEVVWYNLLKRIGYTTEEINEFISGPAFMAWWQMNNLEGWGGPNPDSWYRQQEALQKKIITRMRELGIEPVFPGYAGMVPRNIGEKLGYQIADPGKWCGFPRPAFLSTEDEHFDSFAAMYYEELEKLYGKAKYYSMDPFHEGGNTEGVDLAKAGTSIMSAMKKANPEAVWVMQAWQANPREAMVSTLDSGDLLVLDLYSEKLPQWGDPANGLLQPTAGSIKIAGMAPGPDTKAIVSYLPDAAWLPDWMRVEQLVEMFRDFYADFDPAKANEMLEKLELSPKAPLKSLSKGNKEKVQLILAMSRNARLYLLEA